MFGGNPCSLIARNTTGEFTLVGNVIRWQKDFKEILLKDSEFLTPWGVLAVSAGGGVRVHWKHLCVRSLCRSVLRPYALSGPRSLCTEASPFCPEERQSRSRGLSRCSVGVWQDESVSKPS